MPFESIWKGNWGKKKRRRPLDRGSYVKVLKLYMVPKMFVLGRFSQNIVGFRQNYSQGLKTAYSCNSIWVNKHPLDTNFNFHCLPILYIGFNINPKNKFLL